VHFGGSQLNVKAPVAQNRGIEERMRRDEEQREKLLDPTETLGVKMQHYQSMGRPTALMRMMTTMMLFLYVVVCNDLTWCDLRVGRT
jgi:hypothetical protein